MLDQEIKNQLSQYLELIENQIQIKLSVSNDDLSKEMNALVDEIASMTDKISVEKTTLERTPSFSVNRVGENIGVTFAGLPLGHEFTSLILALLQVSGRAPKIDQTLSERIKNIQGKYHFETYISLSCQICPDVVQALNIMSVLNPNITHSMIDGAAFREEVEAKNVLAVPTVYLNGEFFHSGRISLEEIVEKLGQGSNLSEFENKAPYDVLVIGGGPAGASAAIYAARKGIRTGLVAERMGGQVLDTFTIENVIGIKQTTGPKLGQDLEAHVKEYGVDIMKAQRVKNIEKHELIEIELENGAKLISKTVIIATGARWRNINVPGEQEFKNKGVAYCPHCDGPLFAGKSVAVIGGGNSGIEAAIDLAGIAKHVTVLEFLPDLKADAVLQERLYSLSNVTVLKNVATKAITGTERVNGIDYVDRVTGNEHHLDVEGVFILVGLEPNTSWVPDTIEKVRGEIVVDRYGATSMPGVFAAGDCTNSPYKQIIISMGSGATAALGAFDYLIRH